MVGWFFRSVQYPPYSACILLILHSQQIQKYPDSVGADGKTRVKISGGGANFSRSSSYVLLSFSLLNMGSEVLSYSGEYVATAQ